MHGVLLDTSAVPPNTSWAMVVLGLLGLIYFKFVRPQKRKKDPLARPPAGAALAQQRSVERDMTALLVEYEQVIRTMSSQLETRVAKLDLLIREADDKLAALRTATAEAGRAADRRPPVLDLLAASGRVAALPGSTGSSGLPSGDEAGIGFQGSSELEVVARVEPRPPHADVYGLADEGLGYRQIAQRLDRPYGEIELILALRPKRAARAKGEEESATAAEPAPRGFRPDDQPELVGVLVPGESHGSSSSSERRRPRRSSSEHSPSERA